MECHSVTRKAPEIDTSKNVDYFNNSKTYPEAVSYDQTFRFSEGYNARLKRDDMQHTQVLGRMVYTVTDQGVQHARDRTNSA